MNTSNSKVMKTVDGEVQMGVPEISASIRGELEVLALGDITFVLSDLDPVISDGFSNRQDFNLVGASFVTQQQKHIKIMLIIIRRAWF